MRRTVTVGGLALFTCAALGAVATPGQVAHLSVTLVGNAGVVLSDGETSLLVDLPYESGAFGYMSYRVEDLQPPGRVVSVITHHHADHFDAAAFLGREEWRVIGPLSVTESLPPSRVLDGDELSLGAFTVSVRPTPHTSDHRSYRIRWRGQVLYFVGDTEDPRELATEPAIDVLFVTPWLACAALEAGRPPQAARTIAYHLQPGGGDRICGAAEVLEQGTTFLLEDAPGER